MSNRQTRRQQSRQARRQATSYRGGRSSRPPQGGGGGRGSNFLSWPYLVGVSVFAVALLAVVVVFALRNGGEGEGNETVALLDRALADLPLNLQDGNTLGRGDAPVKMIQYEDFQCPHCLRFTVEHEAFLVEEFVKPGLLQLEFRHLPVVGLESTTAAVGAVCAAEQNRMWEFANRLFAIQARGDRPDSGHFDESSLLEVAADLGLDTDAFAACQADPDSLSTVSGHMAAAQAIGFRGTPSFVLNGAPLQVAPASTDRWRTIIEGLVVEVTGATEPEAEGDAEGDDSG